jgi:transporter family-2 protein
MMKHLILLAAALFAGSLIPLQGAVNSQLSQRLPHAMQATFVSFLGGLLGVMAVLLCIRPQTPSLAALQATPWYLYCGGLFGVVFVTTVLVLIPKIGVAAMLATAITGQLIVSVVIDHYGWLNVPVISVTPTRAAGVCCLLLGVFLIQR